MNSEEDIFKGVGVENWYFVSQREKAISNLSHLAQAR